MSMISSLIDELNKSADEWNGSNMFELARMCREAADTIWQLRDDLQRANAENAKLREQLAKARDPQRIGGTADPESFDYAIEQLREFRWQHATNDEEAIPYINNVADAHERENAKLRDGANAMRQLYEDELKHALADNARLRKTLRRRTEHFNGMCEMWVERGAENAKLRELVSGLEHCCQGFACDCCPLYDPSGTNHRRCESLEHELGIEVD